MELTPNKLKEIRLKCNIEKYLFGQTKKEYLGFWVTHNGVKPLDEQIEAIKNMKPPTYWKEFHKFIGLVNYYWNLLERRSQKL